MQTARHVRLLALSVALMALIPLGCDSQPIETNAIATQTQAAALEYSAERPAVTIVSPANHSVIDLTEAPGEIHVQVTATGCPFATNAYDVLLLMDGELAGVVSDAGTAVIAESTIGMHSLTAVCATVDGALLQESLDTIHVELTDACMSSSECVDENPCSPRGMCLYIGPDTYRCQFGWPDPTCCQTDFDCGGTRYCSPDNVCVDCLADVDCDDGDPCTEDRCEGGVCYASPGEGCCHDSDCDDGLFCTEDVCRDGACVFTPVPDEECCEGHDPAQECPGANACTAAACIDHQCRYGPQGGDNCCVADDGECDDGNPCTLDRCDSDVNLCVSEPDLGNPTCCVDALSGCDDGNPCTLDSCVDFQCQHRDDPLCCNADHPCQENDNPCTVAVCWGTRCLQERIGDCCLENRHCDDGDPCTDDVCAAGTCEHRERETCCLSDIECDDGNPCTLDRCIGTLCKYGPDPELPECCNEDSDCDDGNGCTTDVCQPDHTCAITTVEHPNCCNVDQDCYDLFEGGLAISDDADPVRWYCRNHVCVEDNAPDSCAKNPSCDDGDPCTYDFCDAQGWCRHYAEIGCCRNNGECADGNPCTQDRCENNTCLNYPVDDCCESDEDCDDGDPCTESYCIGSLCRSTSPREGCCSSDADCDDGDACTLDRCDADTNACVREVSAETGCCVSDLACDDGVASTRDRCVNFRCENIEIPNFCEDHGDCSDGNECTSDWCVHGQCRYLPPNHAQASDLPDTCCATVADCPDDGDPCTGAACIAGRCVLDAVEYCSRTVGFTENFHYHQVPPGWTTALSPDDAGGGFDPPPGAEQVADGWARFLPDQAPERSYEGQLISPWLDASGLDTVSLQFDQRADGHTAPDVAELEVRVLTGPGTPWRTVWTMDMAAVPTARWQLVTVDLSAIAGQDRARVAFVYRGTAPTPSGTWQIDWVSVDRGVPPQFRSEPPDVIAPERTVTDYTLFATDADAWQETVGFYRFQLPRAVTLREQRTLTPQALAELMGEELPEDGGAISDGAGTPWGWGYAATLRTIPTGAAGELGEHLGVVEARGQYLRDRQDARVLILPFNGCGDGNIDPGEECDDGQFNSDYAVDGCRTNCRFAYCGDGVPDSGEECDMGAAVSSGLPGEELPCMPDCTWRVDCGDGVKDPGEQCDDGDLNSDTEPDACRTDCTLPVCGDAVVDDGEDCDFGDAISSGDPTGAPTYCNPNCTFTYTCGDGVIEDGEQCDDGRRNSDTEPNACRSNCRLPVCGDAVVDEGEECDFGPAISMGDPGHHGQPVCRPNCTWSYCGDGINDPDEECDDGAQNSDTEPNACRSDCRRAYCGDAVLDDGEQCDDGELTGDTTYSLCLPGCFAFADLTLWPESGEVTIGFEDLPIRKSNDYDYNDWISVVTVQGLYSPRGYLWGLEFSNRPKARGAGYDHDQHILIPGNLLDSGGTYVVRWFDGDGNLVRENEPVRFEAGDDIDILSISHTKRAMPGTGGSWASNAVDCGGVTVGTEMRASLRFEKAVSLDIQEFDPASIGPHGENLFFDPYLYVHNTRERIHKSDIRMVVVPETWRWPQEKSAIWTAYEGCVHKANPPVFDADWYHCTPTDRVWDAYCSKVDSCRDFSAGDHANSSCRDGSVSLAQHGVVGDQTLWVPSSAPDGTGAVVAFDPENGEAGAVVGVSTCANPMRVGQNIHHDVFVACKAGGRVQSFDKAGRTLWDVTLEGVGSLGAVVYHPTSLLQGEPDRLFVGADDGMLYVLDATDGEVIDLFNVGHAIAAVVDADHVYVSVIQATGLPNGLYRYSVLPPFGPARWAADVPESPHELFHAAALALGEDGALWAVADANSYATPALGQRSCRFDSAQMTLVGCADLAAPAADIAVSPRTGDAFVAIPKRNEVAWIAADLARVDTAPVFPAHAPAAVAVDRSGDGLALTASGDVLIISPDGDITDRFGEGWIATPAGTGSDLLGADLDRLTTAGEWVSRVWDGGRHGARFQAVCLDASPASGRIDVEYSLNGAAWLPLAMAQERGTQCLDIMREGQTLQLRMTLAGGNSISQPIVHWLRLGYLKF